MAQILLGISALKAELARERRNRPRLSGNPIEQFAADGHVFVTRLPHFCAAAAVLPDMKHELARIIGSSPAHATLTVGDIRWNIYVFGVSRIGGDMFVQMALSGPRDCTVTVRARAPIGNPATARRVLAVVREWILAGEFQDQAYLELENVRELAS